MAVCQLLSLRCAAAYLASTRQLTSERIGLRVEDRDRLEAAVSSQQGGSSLHVDLVLRDALHRVCDGGVGDTEVRKIARAPDDSASSGLTHSRPDPPAGINPGLGPGQPWCRRNVLAPVFRISEYQIRKKSRMHL